MINNISTMKSIPPKNCSGCAACANVCNRSAISMQINADGFYNPIFDTEKCVHCGLCEKACPSNNIVESPAYTKTSPKSVATFAKEDAIRLESSSGGIFTVLAQKVLSEGGYVVGVAQLTPSQFGFTIIDNVVDLSKLRGSKYVQANVGEVYRDVRSLLKTGKKVLFSGTPCQVAALYAVLGDNKRENLITVDLVCHGVPTRLLYDKYCSELENEKGKVIQTIFRDKTFGWKLYSMTNVIEYSNNGNCFQKKISSHHKENPYMRIFLSDLCLNDSCFECKYAKIPRIADISLADFWAIRSFFKDLDDDKGISLVLLNTEYGEHLFDSIDTNQIFSCYIDFEKVKKHSPRIYSPVQQVDEGERRIVFGELKNDRISLEQICRKHYLNRLPLIKRIYYKIKAIKYTLFPL